MRIIRFLILLNIIGFFSSSSATEKSPCDPVLAGQAANGQQATVDYDKLITSSAGAPEVVKVFLDGKTREFVMSSQVEFEKRINLPGKPTAVVNYASSLLGQYYAKQYETMKSKTAGGAMVPEHWQGAIQLAPLKSKHEHFHDSQGIRGVDTKRKIARWQTEPTQNPQGHLVQEISGARIYLRPLPRLGGYSRSEEGGTAWSDYIDSSYLVGWQDENGIYFDTDSELLKQLAIAARLKLWAPKDKRLGFENQVPPEDGLENVVHRMVTIKKTLRHDHGFTRRIETQGEWPKDLTLGQAVELIRATLIQKYGLSSSQLKTLAPRYRTVNQRIGVNLIDVSTTEPLKLGFMTVDQFQVYDLTTGQLKTSESINQLEFEIFPQLKDFVFKNPQRLANVQQLMDDVLKRTGGIATSRPKYLHHDPVSN